jgi:hypothetical protein
MQMREILHMTPVLKNISSATVTREMVICPSLDPMVAQGSAALALLLDTDSKHKVFIPCSISNL